MSFPFTSMTGGVSLTTNYAGKDVYKRQHMCDKAYKKAHEKLTKEVKTLAHSPDDTAQFIQLQKYNSVVAGLHEYYCIATETTCLLYTSLNVSR